MARFVLTPHEKRVLIFIAASFLLGLGAKYYRVSHPGPPPETTHAATGAAPKKHR